MSIDVQLLPTINVVQISVDGDSVYIRRDKCTEFLGKLLDAMAEAIPDEHSVKVPPTLTVLDGAA